MDTSKFSIHVTGGILKGWHGRAHDLDVGPGNGANHRKIENLRFLGWALGRKPDEEP
jgi:hypothetical protein